MSLHALTVAGGPHALQMQTTHLLAAPRCPAGFCSIVAPERPLRDLLFCFVFRGRGGWSSPSSSAASVLVLLCPSCKATFFLRGIA